jgi:hypothetical protein
MEELLSIPSNAWNPFPKSSMQALCHWQALSFQSMKEHASLEWKENQASAARKTIQWVVAVSQCTLTTASLRKAVF